jgi:hypothetical protein
MFNMEHSSLHEMYMGVTGSEYVGMDSRKETDIPIETSAAGS